MFDEYNANRICLRKELEEGHNDAWTHVLVHYVSLLLGVLKRHVLHHSFTMATATMETMTMAMDQVPDIIRRVGVAVLSHEVSAHDMSHDMSHGLDSMLRQASWDATVQRSCVGVAEEEAGCRETLQFLKHMFTWLPKQRVAILLETAAFIGSHGNLQEAYATLQSQLNSEPFKSDFMVHGFSAILQYLLWKKEVWPYREEAELFDEVKESSRAKAFSRKALQHFQGLESLGAPPSRVMDAFTAIHAQLLCELGQDEEALKLLVSNRDRSPYRLSAAKMVCEHVEKYGGADEGSYSDHLAGVVAVDDSSPCALQLAAHLLRNAKGDDGRLERVLKLVVNFLSYPHNSCNPTTQQVLQALQEQWPDYQQSVLWTQHSQQSDLWTQHSQQ